MQIYGTVILRDFPFKSALFGLVIHHDPWINSPNISGEYVLVEKKTRTEPTTSCLTVNPSGLLYVT